MHEAVKLYYKVSFLECYIQAPLFFLKGLKDYYLSDNLPAILMLPDLIMRVR